MFPAIAATDVVSRPVTSFEGLPTDGSFPSETVDGTLSLECVDNGIARVLISILIDSSFEGVLTFGYDRICERK